MSQSSSATANFRLKFSLSKDLEIVLHLHWLEENRQVKLLHKVWPTSPEEIEALALALFPLYRARKTRLATLAHITKRRRERYYKKLMPDVQEHTIQSNSRPGIFHIVKQVDKGKTIRFECSCEHWHWRCKQTGEHCDHIREVLGEAKEKPVTMQHRIIPLLKLKIGRTLRTFDCDVFLEEAFQHQVTRAIQRLMLTSG